MKKFKYIVFDVDNTLYHPKTNLFKEIDKLIQDFISEKLDVDGEQARRYQKQYYHEYGATLFGLVKFHDIDPEEFSDKVHAIDYSKLKKNQKLIDAIKSLTIDKYIFTNGSYDHAINILKASEIENDFITIYDLKAGDYIAKPNRSTYDKFFSENKLDPQFGIFIDDLPDNLVVPKLLNMYTICPYYKDKTASFSHIDLMTDDLAETVSQISQLLKGTS